MSLSGRVVRVCLGGFWVLLALLLPGTLSANELPRISNIHVTVDEALHTLTVTYDVSDPDNTTVKILFCVRQDGAPVKPVSGYSGDIGYPVAVGVGKRMTWRYDSTWTATALRKLKFELVADDMSGIPIGDLVSQVDTARLRQSVLGIYGERGSHSATALVGIGRVKADLVRQFTDRMLAVEQQPIPYKEKEYTGHNIIGRKAGFSEAPKTYILCAHFDAANGSPGGDDNATGVAGLLECARILSRYNFEHAINFIGFDLEEVGLKGSSHYVFQRGIKGYEVVDGVVNFDMIGFFSEKPNSQYVPDGFDQLYPEAYQAVSSGGFRGNFVVATFNAGSLALNDQFRQAANRYVPALRVVSLQYQNAELTPTLAASDHYNFWRKKIPAIHIGDGGESRNVNMNTSRDTLRGLNYGIMAEVVKATIASLAEMAKIFHGTVTEFTLP